jgi:hypothetical protein
MNILVSLKFLMKSLIVNKWDTLNIGFTEWWLAPFNLRMLQE